MAIEKDKKGWLRREYSLALLASALAMGGLGIHYGEDIGNVLTGNAEDTATITIVATPGVQKGEESLIVQALANPAQIKQINVEINYSDRLGAEFDLRASEATGITHEQDHMDLDLRGDTVKIDYFGDLGEKHKLVESKTISVESLPVSIRNQIAEYMKAAGLPVPVFLGGNFTTPGISVEDELAACPLASEEGMLAGQIIQGYAYLKKPDYEVDVDYKSVKCGDTPRDQAYADEFVYGSGFYRLALASEEFVSLGDGTSDRITDASEMNYAERKEVRERIEKTGMPVPLAFK